MAWSLHLNLFKRPPVLFHSYTIEGWCIVGLSHDIRVTANVASTAFSLKSKWSSTQDTGRAIWNRSSRVIRTPKGSAVSDVAEEPIRGSRPHPPLDSHVSLRAARFIYYVQPLTPLPSWRQVFQFLISLLRCTDTRL